MRVPQKRVLASPRLLACIMADMVVPLLKAMRLSVSPSCTSYQKPPVPGALPPLLVPPPLVPEEGMHRL